MAMHATGRDPFSTEGVVYSVCCALLEGSLATQPGFSRERHLLAGIDIYCIRTVHVSECSSSILTKFLIVRATIRRISVLLPSQLNQIIYEILP